MRNITEKFGTLYHPVKALVVYRDNEKKNVYVEAYDMDQDGLPKNAHPLTVRESISLAKALDTSEDMKRNFLKPAGLMPAEVLYLNTDHNGYAVWRTPQQRVKLLFTDSLGIPNGTACLPPMVWKADREKLWIYAVKADENMTVETPLFHAPYFNIHKNGLVCMGTVNIAIPPDCMLEEFIRQWELYFYNSYFSHLIESHSPVRRNIVQLWQSLINTNKKFPLKVLTANGYTLKNLIG